jgi:hypothetical protein
MLFQLSLFYNLKFNLKQYSVSVAMNFPSADDRFSKATSNMHVHVFPFQ